MEAKIRLAVAEALAKEGIEGISFSVERPGDEKHGDYATNAALVAAKALKQNPRDFAQKLTVRLQEAFGASMGRIEVAGPGFVNMSLSRATLLKALERVLKAGARWGHPYDFESLEGERIMVEYTSPNLFKPLHIGNLIGNILGESVTRLLENQGAAVVRINYPSDIGLTVAKGVWGLKTHKLDPTDIAQLGKAYVLGNAAYEEGAGEKKEIEEINRLLYAGTDTELNRLREAGITTSRKHLEDLCAALGTHFDEVFFESQSGPLGRDIVQAHIADGIFEKSDGAVIYRGEKKGLHTRVFINSQGLPTYEAKDVGLFDLKSRANPDFSASLTVTGGEQSDYFKVVFAAIADIFPDRVAGKQLRHLANGFLRLTTGKMSSRKGNVITGESLLDDLKKRVQERSPDPLIAEQVAVGAIKYMVLRQAPGQDIIFDPEKSLSLEGDSGPYLQYALVRARSVLAQAQKSGTPAAGAPEASYLLERVILHFPEVAARATRELAPNLLVTYLTELAGEWNSFYAKERIIGAEYEAHKLMLARAFAHTMENGLRLLGIPTPEQM